MEGVSPYQNLEAIGKRRGERNTEYNIWFRVRVNANNEITMIQLFDLFIIMIDPWSAMIHTFEFYHTDCFRGSEEIYFSFVIYL